MKKLGFLASMICAALFLLPTAASAQATRTWVSGVGSDSNPCSRTAPCQTFPGAITKTAAGGEIDTLDPGGFGAVTITKAVTIADEGTGEAGILVAGTNGVTVNCSTDPTCVVILRGLNIDGGPIGSNSLNGVRFIAGGGLIIQHCTIRNFTGGAPNGYGVFFAPSATQTFFLAIDDTTIVDNGPAGGFGGGVFIQPQAGGSPTINVAINHVQSSHNGFGFAADTTLVSAAPGAGVFMSITDSEASGNQNGGVAAITPTSGGAAVNVNLDRVTISGNNVGVNAKGATAIVRIANSKVITNQTGFKQANAPTVTTLGNNQFFDNPTPGPAPVLAGPQ